MHHKQPKSLEGENTIENALGVCRTPCHDALDVWALNGRIYYPEVLMEEGFWYMLLDHPRTNRIIRERPEQIPHPIPPTVNLPPLQTN